MERSSNFELMRIVAMLMIVAGHFINQSGLKINSDGVDLYVLTYLGSASRIAVNMFIMLGVWFMVEAQFKAKRILKLYFNVWVLTAGISILLLLLGYSLNSHEVAKSILPFIGRGVWFPSTYIALILLSPWLKKFFYLSSASQKNFLIIAFLLVSGIVTVYAPVVMEDYWLDTLCWFVVIYLFIGYYRKNVPGGVNEYFVLFIGIIFYSILVSMQLCTSGVWQKTTAVFLADYKTIPNMIISFCFFYFFQHMNIGVSRIINYVASGAFTTYIVHQTLPFIHVLWFDIYKCEWFYDSDYKIIYSLCVIFSVYSLGLVIERLRVNYVEPVIFNTSFLKFLENKLDAFYKNI